jgi:hypothetical protein
MFKIQMTNGSVVTADRISPYYLNNEDSANVVYEAQDQNGRWRSNSIARCWITSVTKSN